MLHDYKNYSRLNNLSYSIDFEVVKVIEQLISVHVDTVEYIHYY